MQSRKEEAMSENEIRASATIYLNDHALSVHRFHTHLHEWGTVHQRIFPWRTTDNPFHILIAELMLRRTQARQVVAVYNRFIAQYPDARTLAEAPAEEVARALLPLGLAWRVPAFQQIAQVLTASYAGRVPESYDALIALPGVGDYVASAVCCFAFQRPVPIIDTNTVRVAGRLFGVATHAESRRRQPVRRLLSDMLNRQDPRSYNYHLLDLASLICIPVQPRCSDCPLVQLCANGQLRNVIVR